MSESITLQRLLREYPGGNQLCADPAIWLFFARLAQRISQLVDIPLTHAESFQVVHYGPQQEYKAHFDAWDAGANLKHQHSLHRGMPVTSGEKWAANLWFRQRYYRWKPAAGN
jgi:hypothetical protein